MAECDGRDGKASYTGFVPAQKRGPGYRFTDTFVVKDSGARQEFASGMVRDTHDGKTDYTRVLEGPMFQRWAEHLTKGAAKYPDLATGEANWTLADSEAEMRRFRKSAFRHFLQWFRGEIDEDHAAAVFFNLNGVEYVKARLANDRAGEPVPEDPRA